jgi:hypothetical protein
MKTNPAAERASGVSEVDLLDGPIDADPTSAALRIQRLVSRFGLSLSCARLIAELAGLARAAP